MTDPASPPASAAVPPVESLPNVSPPRDEGGYEFDAFVSYSWKDKKMARALYERLVGAGLRIWLDEKQVLLGESIPEAIEKGIERSRHLIILLSKASLASRYATLERQKGIESDPDARRLTLLPVLLEDGLDPLPRLLRHRRSVRLHDPSGLDEVVDEVVRAIRGPGAVAPPQPRRPTPEPPAPTPEPPAPTPEPRRPTPAPDASGSKKRALLVWGGGTVALGLAATAPAWWGVFSGSKRPPGEEQGAAGAALPEPTKTVRPEATQSAATVTAGVAGNAASETPKVDVGGAGNRFGAGPTPPKQGRAGGPQGPATSASTPGAGGSPSAVGTGPAADPSVFATSGKAKCTGVSCTLDLGGRALPTGATRVVLVPTSPEPALYGHTASCVVQGGGPGCMRSDEVAMVALRGELTWRLK